MGVDPKDITILSITEGSVIITFEVKGEDITELQVLIDIQARDARDASRDTAPMVVAPDALVLDTSEMSIAQSIAAALAAIEGKLSLIANGIK